ncbi:MAG: hydroxyacid dehydrogenase [Bdellovibrio sp.]|nr:MAG: hydroxyacid dehydrogenase [Bdellovibrio sp.]
MAKISFYEVKPKERKYLQGKLKNHKLRFFEDPLNDKNIVKDSDVISVFIYSKVDSSLLRKLQRLKLVATRSTGYDHISVEDCRKKNVAVCNVPYYGENTVAEHTFGLMLALSRNIHKSYVRTLKNDFSTEGLTGFDLKDKTIGIIGGGHIGMHVARMARAFGMHVRVYDVRKDSFLAEVINFKYVPLDELLRISDIITLHVPYNKHTHHLINKKNIKKIKKGAILINTSRGAVVDTDALYEALKSKRLRGAGLDVIEGEEIIKEEHQLLHNKQNLRKWRTIIRNHKIFNMENVVFTPHNAFNSEEALLRILDTTADNIKSFLARKPKNVVN